MTRTLLLAITAGCTLLGGGTLGCAGGDDGRERVLLVATTSLESSGFLDALLEAYHDNQDRYRLAPTAVGSGAALELGRRGDADVLLTHDPEGERQFMDQGYGVERSLVMTNEFVLAGPADDPAGIRNAEDPSDALNRVGTAGATFLSRGDDSGTHRKEHTLWAAVDREPWDGADWYVEAGSGMGETLRMASQLQAYVLTDGASLLFMGDQLELEPLWSGHPTLENRYSVILPAGVGNTDGARDFVGWLLGPGQELIRSYGADQFGEPLFRPAAAGGAD